MLLLEGVQVSFLNQQTPANANGGKPTLTNHPADGFGMKAPTKVNLGRI
jgi:hypothetical protein